MYRIALISCLLLGCGAEVGQFPSTSLPKVLNASQFEVQDQELLARPYVEIVPDMTGDGLDDLLLLENRKAEVTAYQMTLAHSQGGHSTFLRSDPLQPVRFVFDVGDLNGDDVDDLLVTLGDGYRTGVRAFWGPLATGERSLDDADWSFQMPSPLESIKYRPDPMRVFRVDTPHGEQLLMCTADFYDDEFERPVCYAMPLPLEAGEVWNTAIPYVGATLSGPEWSFTEALGIRLRGYGGYEAEMCDLDGNGVRGLFGGFFFNMAVFEDLEAKVPLSGDLEVQPTSEHVAGTGDPADWPGFGLLRHRCGDLTGDGVDDLLLLGVTNRSTGSYHTQIVLLEGPFADLAKAFERRILIAEGGRLQRGFELIGDLDGDGIDDFAHRKAMKWNGSQPAEPWTLVLYLSSRGWDDPVHIQDDESSQFGAGVSRGGDLDGDGLLDFAVAAPDSNKLYIITGKRLRELAVPPSADKE